METINTYIARHLQSREYRRRLTENSTPGFENTSNWIDYVINSNLIFSYRSTHYTKSTFREKLHSHDFYELVIYVSGDVRYVCESRELISPEPGDMIVSTPGRVHTGILKKESDYTRYVFYFNPDAFGSSAEKLLEFYANTPFLRLGCDPKRLFALLDGIREVCTGSSPVSELLAYSYVIQLFCLIGDNGEGPSGTSRLTAKALEIKSYIDSHAGEINGVSELAERFFYSREYLSRYFSRTFNIPIGQYITERRIELAKRLLSGGHSVTDTALECGFENVSFFIRVFKAKVGLTPHKYAKSLRETDN